MINFFIILSIWAAIGSAFFAYRFARIQNWHAVVTVLFCIAAAAIGGAFWLPATIIMSIVVAKELRTA